jgi:hypothetical protein
MTIDHIEEILAGCPSKDTLRWLQKGFTSHVKFHTPLTNALGLDQFPRGLPSTVKLARRRALLFDALRLVDSAECSIQSTANRLSADLIRLATRARPRNEYEEILCNALDASPDASMESGALWYIVKEYRAQI